MKNPYLSVVITGRNDNYGGDFNERLQGTVHWLAHWVERYKISSELLFVNYNPIIENAKIEEQINWPKNNAFFKTRIITVPSEIHEKFIDLTVRKTIPLFEFIAKNIGIRRTKGQFILCTNADILFSEKIFGRLAKQDLEKGCLYRCSRLDFNTLEVKLTENSNWKVVEEKIKKNVFKFFLQGGTFDLRFPLKLEARIKILEFLNAKRKSYYRMIAKLPFIEYVPYLPKMFPDELFVFDYHCNASGDFALMDRDSWLNGGSYPENTWISTHTDSLHLINVAVSNIRVEVWPYFVYHRDHERRFDFSKKNRDMEKMYQRLLEDTREMLLHRKPISRNDADWGLKGVELLETKL